MSLVPEEIVERHLISSTSRLVGEYVSANFIITHAWPHFWDSNSQFRFQAGPTSRSAYLVNFIVPEVKKEAGAVIPDYSGFAETVCALLSLLFGKRFDYHGAIQSNGRFMLPQLDQFADLSNPNLGYNSHVSRSDYSIPLNLNQVSRIVPLLFEDAAPVPAITAFRTAAKFYQRALQSAESESEIAYLHLITSGEILTNIHMPESADYLDEGVKEILDEIRRILPDGEVKSRMLSKSLRHIKRRFRLTLTDLIDKKFFDGASTIEAWGAINADQFDKRMAAAYDVRSRYIHTGTSFGRWVAPRNGYEVNPGKPVMRDEKLARLLQMAPTCAGLERVIRYCLIKYADRNGLLIDGPL